METKLGKRKYCRHCDEFVSASTYRCHREDSLHQQSIENQGLEEGICIVDNTMEVSYYSAYNIVIIIKTEYLQDESNDITIQEAFEDSFTQGIILSSIVNNNF